MESTKYKNKSDMAKIGIIINPYSKRIKKLKTDPVEYYKKICGDYATVILTNTLDEISKAASEFNSQGISYLAISGGDGSIHQVISRFINEYRDKDIPYVLILRDGSMNNIARSYNLKGRGRDLLLRLIKAIADNRNIDIVYRNTMKVNNMYCFLFGTGIVANYINEFNKGGKKNPRKAIKVLFKGLFLALFNKNNKGYFKRQEMTVYIDDTKLWFSDIFGIFASTIANLAISFRPTPRAYEKEKIFHLIASGLKPFDLVLRINKFRTGKPIRHKYHYDNIASELKMVSGEKFLYQMDGDIYESGGELTVTAGPKVGFVSI